MMCLALAGKCPGRGASGSLGGGAGVANRFSFIKDARARVPRPTPQSLNNWRRVRYLRISSPRFITVSFEPRAKRSYLFLGDCFIQVQQHVGDNGPGGQLRDVFSLEG